ncbi:MAG: hypothetical protein K2P81_17130 [Bacteriovoracaceae bacterium]|nr:hypothetical protein [Bacteriovoracaceae bacterium]
MVIFLWFLFVTNVFAFHQVDQIVDTKSLIVKLDPEHFFITGDRVVILSKQDGSMSAIGRVKSVSQNEFPETAVIDILEVIGDRLVLAGDPVERLTVEALEKYHVDGHISLLLSQDGHVPAKYKDLAYLGVFNSDGHTLAKGEWLASIPQVQYGVNESFTLKVNNGLYLDGFANLGAKARLMRNHWGHLTLNSTVSRQINQNDWVVLAGLVLTLPSNEKFQTHLVINALIDGIEEENPEVKKLNLFPASDVRTIYEFVTEDWNRVLFGPLFNFETQTVGGTISYMWIWDTFHLNIGVGSKDVSQLRFGKEGYYGLFDFFWRF